jgi:glycosyltransferase involved in cell wall biosynthesis
VFAPIFQQGAKLMAVRSLDQCLEDTRTIPPEDQEVPSSQTANKPIKVMYIISDLSIGGAEMTLYKLLTETNRERFEPVVISLIDQGTLRERIEALGIAVHTARMKPGWPTPAGLWRLIKLIRNLGPDLILGWMYHSCLAAEVAKICSGKRIPVIWSIHYSLSSLVTEKKLTVAVIKLCGLLSRLPSKVVFVSEAGQTQHEPLGYRIEQSCVIPNGIDVKEFIPSDAARLSVRAELGIPEEVFLIGLIGRYHPMKDHANFLAAAALISETQPDTHFLLIGRGVDEHNQQLSDSIRRLGLLSRTHLLGERRDTSRLAAALDLFSLSSYGESCPNVIGEAMACGVPCVVTDVGDTTWIVGETGRVIPPRNASALALAWQEMIEMDPQERKALGLLARARVIEHFPIQAVMARYEDLYETVLASEARGEVVSLTSPRIGSLGATFEETGAQ